jgi:gas vesicle protein
LKTSKHKRHFMTTFKKVTWTIGISMAAGAIIGMLYAPWRGAETRKKISKVKRKLTGKNETERETLEDLSFELTKQLHLVNERLEELS